MTENGNGPTINFPVKLRDLLVGAAALGAGGFAGSVGLDQIRGGPAQGALAQSQQPVDPAFKREVGRNFNDVDRRINRVEESLSTIRSEQRDQGQTLDTIKCIVTDYETDDCALMRPRNRGGR